MEINAISDYHVHVRQDEQLKTLVPFTSLHCGRFMPMPNRIPPVTNRRGMLQYAAEIQPHVTHGSEVLMTLKLLEATSPDTIADCAAHGCTAVKIYPEGVTTHSADGISRDLIKSLLGSPYSVEEKLFHHNLKAIEDAGLVLCWHGEMPGEEVLLREAIIFPYIEALLERFLKLRVVFEHVTTARVVERIGRLYYRYKGRIAATITPHHMRNTLTDLLGGLLHPHLFCKPVLKNNEDRAALVRAATSGLDCYFLGSDSAPWLKEKKECADGCAGVWNSPCLVETLAEIFAERGALKNLERFTSQNGDRFYGKEPVNRRLYLKEEPWVMPTEIEGMVPYRAGETIRWQVVEG